MQMLKQFAVYNKQPDQKTKERMQEASELAAIIDNVAP